MDSINKPLDDWFKSKGFSMYEGHIGECHPEMEQLISLTKTPNVKVMQIGYNAGHSANLFLSQNPTLQLTSFDIATHPYCTPSVTWMNNTYPGRHSFIAGDSRTSVPEFHQRQPTAKFDVILIDGCHDYEYAIADLSNCSLLAHENTIVIMDDFVSRQEWTKGYTIGPTQAWKEFVEQGKLLSIEEMNFSSGRGMAWGKYIRK